MKTKRITMKAFGIFSAFLFTLLISNPLQAQSASNTQTVKGIVTDTNGPLESVNIVLMGENIGTTTNKKGEFTFPKELSAGQVLQFSYLGYQTQEIEVEANTKFINLLMSEELVEIIGDLAADTPYKSKRK